jgi:predicted homoserine dehydrogenase-like protein
MIVDAALKAREAEGRPIRVGMIGAGFMARGVANQIISSVPGMRMSAVYARRIEQATGVYTYVDPTLTPVAARSQDALDAAVEAGQPVVTDDPMLLCRSAHIEALLDVTGAVELGAQVALEAIAYRKCRSTCSASSAALG